MPNDLKPLLDGLQRAKRVSLDGALAGAKGAAAGVTLDMRDTTAHGDVTGATRANYTAYAVGRGATGSQELQRSVAAVEKLNPGHSATAPVQIDGEIGIIVTSATDYQSKLETEAAGAKAVLGPTMASSGQRFTRAIAEGSRKALS